QGSAIVEKMFLCLFSPICNIEVPERLLSCYDYLQCYNLVERCITIPVREGTENEIMLVHSADYLEVVKSTQEMKEEELQKTSADYDSVYFHPTTFRCAKLAVGATLELVDAVMLGKTRNGMALVRPPGHHSQRNAANGFCIFNNVAIAAKYAQRTYGLQRILIVDWDVHHGQGTQYLFDADPSVLYFSWHRFEHQQFWPSLSESNYDAVGQEKGRGFNINVPWNKIGMGNSDYIAAFLHVLLPVAFEGGYHLRSLSESVCMTIKALLGDPLPCLSGEMAPCLSAVESVHNVRAAHKPYWQCLMYEGNGRLSKDVETNNFFSPLLGFILPVAYSYQPDLTFIVLGPNQNLGRNEISLLISLLQGLAQSQILVLIQVKGYIDLIYAPDLKDNVQRIKELRKQLQQEWKLLQCSGK
uniref:Histone deacetylase 10 n=1 Tax=Varanus komodoensis TaxID=61221 RepID=A0A8D2LM67_VARKO